MLPNTDCSVFWHALHTRACAQHVRMCAAAGFAYQHRIRHPCVAVIMQSLCQLY